MRVNFGLESYQHRSRPLSSQRMINCYVEGAPSQAKTKAAIVESYGIQAALTVGTGATRGAIEVNDVLYAVVGQTLYRIPETGDAVALGTIPGSHYVDMAGDETHVMCVTHRSGFVYDGTSVTQITSGGFPAADWVKIVSGFFIVGKTDTGEFFYSSNRDPLTWDALGFESAEEYPDNNVGAETDHGELILFGKRSGQVFRLTGAADNPFEASPNGLWEVGLMSRFAHAKVDNSIDFLGHDGVVYKLNGYAPERISTYWIEQIIEDWPDKTCFALTWIEGGHKMFALSSDYGTVVFDHSTGMWHERKSVGLIRWRPLFIIRAYDQWWVGDFYSNRIGTLDANYFSEWSNVLSCSATSSSISNDNARVRHSMLELVFETGVGLVTGQGSDPKVMLRFSNDGGRTWSNEKWRSLGAMGNFKARTRWFGLGAPRDRVYEYTITDPVRRTLILATTNVEQLAN